jgi:hypothetical protein
MSAGIAKFAAVFDVLSYAERVSMVLYQLEAIASVMCDTSETP